MRRIYKHVVELEDPELREIAKKSIVCVKVKINKNEKRQLVKTKPFWEEKDWSTYWNLRKTMAKSHSKPKEYP